jgi:hypothetical protein
LEAVREVVVAIVIATPRCTPVATFTEKNAIQVSTIIHINIRIYRRYQIDKPLTSMVMWL